MMLRPDLRISATRPCIAGSIASPQLLQQSGVGPPALREKLGVPQPGQERRQADDAADDDIGSEIGSDIDESIGSEEEGKR